MLKKNKMRIIDHIKKIFRKLRKKEVMTEISPESLKTNEEIMHLQKALAYEKGRRIKAEKIIKELNKVGKQYFKNKSFQFRWVLKIPDFSFCLVRINMISRHFIQNYFILILYSLHSMFYSSISL